MYVALFHHIFYIILWVRFRFDTGKKLCRRVLKTRPTLTKMWLILARLEAKSDNVDNARQVS